MGIPPELERKITIQIIQEDAETIYSLLNSERDSIFVMEIIPYYALFVQSCQEYMGENFLPENSAKKINDIRNHIKAYADGFGKTKRKVSKVDAEQDAAYSAMLRFPFMRKWNIPLNLGTYWTEDHHVIGNTQQIAAFLGIKDMSDPNLGEAHRELGMQIGSFVASIRNGMAVNLPLPNIKRGGNSARIDYYYDLNTNKQNSLFPNNREKDLNIFYLNLLCNLNFVKHILRPLFVDGQQWVFRVEYIVTYYTMRALQHLKNHCDNNPNAFGSMSEIITLINDSEGLFASKLRNCMMHYDLESQGVLKEEYLDKKLYGIVESCLDGMDYNIYLSKLRSLADKMIDFLASKFNCAEIDLKLL